MKEITIAGHTIEPGEFKSININIARLPSHTIINTPVYISRALEDGPVLALMAGMHGDEINGMEIVRRILEKGLHQTKRGTVICMPIVNMYGFLNYSRDVPDGKDINRSFPGTKGGSLASRVAYHVTHSILPAIDVGIDFHTGGAMRANYPQVRAVLKDEDNWNLAQAFHAPFTIDSSFRPNSLRKEAASVGKKIIVYEGGESLRFDQHAISIGIEGALRLMKYLGMNDEAPTASEPNKIIWSTGWIRATTAGLFRSNVNCGQHVQKGDWVGNITDPFGEFESKIIAPETGYIIGLNNIPVVNAGDALMHIGTENYCKLES
jgi:predicted deacylase